MNYLLDTSTFLRYVSLQAELSQQARPLLETRTTMFI